MSGSKVSRECSGCSTVSGETTVSGRRLATELYDNSRILKQYLNGFRLSIVHRGPASVGHIAISSLPKRSSGSGHSLRHPSPSIERRGSVQANILCPSSAARMSEGSRDFEIYFERYRDTPDTLRTRRILHHRTWLPTMDDQTRLSQDDATKSHVTTAWRWGRPDLCGSTTQAYRMRDGGRTKGSQVRWAWS